MSLFLVQRTRILVAVVGAALVALVTLVALPSKAESIPEGYRVKKVLTGYASVYWPGDGHSGKFRADGKPFTAEQCHIAHRTWRLGSRVRVCSKRTNKCVLSYVRDRGPFGACLEGLRPNSFQCRKQWVLKIQRTDPGTWRGIADLSRCVANQIGHKGIQKIRLQLLEARVDFPGS